MLRKLFYILIVGACFTLLATPCLAQPQHQPSSEQDDPLKRFLQEYLGKPNPPSEKLGATRYSSVLVDLKEDSTSEFIVYVTGREWCGTGGCMMLILAPEGTSYRVVTKAPVTRLPIRVLATKSNGWHDISVVARINGIEPLYEEVLSFDGETYTSNPFAPSTPPFKGEDHGKIVIPATAKGAPLYQ